MITNMSLLLFQITQEEFDKEFDMLTDDSDDDSQCYEQCKNIQYIQSYNIRSLKTRFPGIIRNKNYEIGMNSGNLYIRNTIMKTNKNA